MIFYLNEWGCINNHVLCFFLFDPWAYKEDCLFSLVFSSQPHHILTFTALNTQWCCCSWEKYLWLPLSCRSCWNINETLNGWGCIELVFTGIPGLCVTGLLASISGSPLATCQIPIHKCHGESVCHTGCVYVALTGAYMLRQDPLMWSSLMTCKMLSHIVFIHKNKQLYTVLQPWTDGCTLIFLNIWGEKNISVSILNISHNWLAVCSHEDPIKSKFVGGFAT